MVRRSFALFFKDGGGNLIGNALCDILVCPLTKQPLRHCQSSQSLISDTVGASFPIVDGIPCLVPKDGKLLDNQIESKGDDSSNANAESRTT